ncbi:DUF5994 family protein [Actinophytocola sp. NPDC049390]|uniref:DUF5994 family protein n=1 Tax=Actinophytocola sp. NPDC049390 TaxID=3363894 RepID=UPI0037915A93
MVHHALPLRNEVRVRMKGSPTTHDLDGAWWPRSRTPGTEFPELVLVMSSWVGPVNRVLYRTGDWDLAQNSATSEGWPFDLEEAGTLQPDTVMVVGTHQRRRTLLVVPPEVPERVARALLSWAAGPDAVGSAEQVLARNGIRPRPHTPRQ